MKKSSLLPILLGSLFVTFLNAQVSFQKRYGSNSQSFERVGNAVPTPGGGLLLGGFTESGAQGGYDVFIQKLQPEGTEVWLKTFGGPDLDALSDLIPAAGGGYLFSGYSINPDNGSFDAVLAKINDNGDLLWWKTYGSTALEVALALCQRTDGSIMLFGSTMDASNQPALFRAAFDQNGNFLSSFLTATTDDIADIKAIATPDGGYLAEITGGNIIFGVPDALLKYNVNHQQQWVKTPASIGTQIGQSVENVYDICASATGFIAALSTSNGVQIAQLSNTGNVTWQNKASAAYGSAAGLQSFADGTIRVAVLSTNLLLKTLSAAGATLDSMTMTPSTLPSYHLEFVFPDAQSLYLFANLNSGDQNDYAVARIAGLALVWQQTLGEPGVPDRESGYAIAALPDGGFVLAGSKQDAEGKEDVWLLRANAQGAIGWESVHSISDGIYDNERVGSVELDAAGNLIVFASTDYSDPEYRLLKFSPSGSLIFDKTAVSSDETPDFFRALPLADGGFIACVTLDYDSPVPPRPSLIRFNNMGDVVWTKNYVGRLVHDLAVLPDGNMVAVGEKNDRPWIFRTDANGTLLWEKTYDVAAYGSLNSIRLAADGSLFGAGSSSNQAETEISALMLKTNAAGDQLWLSEFSKGPGGYWQAGTVLPDANGGACFLGPFLAPPANPDFLSSIFRLRLSLSQVNASGNLVSEQSFGNEGTFPYGFSAAGSPDGQVIFCATVSDGTAVQDAWVVKADCTVGVAAMEAGLAGLLELSPNPAPAGGQISLLCDFSEAKTLQLRCVDVAGKKLWEKTVDIAAGENRLALPAPAVSGFYFLKITDERGGSRTIRMVAQ